MKKKIFSRIIAFALCLMLALPVLAACKDDDDAAELVGLNVTANGLNAGSVDVYYTSEISVNKRFVATPVFVNASASTKATITWEVTKGGQATTDATITGGVLKTSKSGDYAITAKATFGEVTKTQTITAKASEFTDFAPINLSAEYTYNTSYSGMANDWNPFTGTGEDMSLMLQWMRTGLYSYLLDKDAYIDYISNDNMSAIGSGVGQIISCEGASQKPIDITEELIESNGYGTQAGRFFTNTGSTADPVWTDNRLKEGDTGRAWKIYLNPDLQWDNGDEITNEDYLYSIKQFLDPAQKNGRIGDLSDGEGSILGAGAHARGYASAQNFDQSVGFYIGEDSEGEYIVFIYTNERTQDKVMTSNTGGWLVHKPTYEASLVNVSGTMVRQYNKPSAMTGTPALGSPSYGPYKLTGWDDGQAMTFTRNENWHGYTDGNHNGQFQASRIRYNILTGGTAPQTADLMFRQGQLEAYGVNIDFKDNYQTAPDRWFYTPSEQVWKLETVTNLEALAAIDRNGTTNATLLAIPEFRQALSLSMDRNEMVYTTTAASVPAYTLISSVNWVDMNFDTSLFYRDTDEAKQVLIDFFNLRYVGDGKGDLNGAYEYASRDEAINLGAAGYDFARSVELFNEVYDFAIANPQYFDPTKGIVLNLYGAFDPGDLDDLTTAYARRFVIQAKCIEDALKASKFGTGRTISVTPRTGEESYADPYYWIRDGLIEFMVASISGSSPSVVDALEIFVSDSLDFWYNPYVLDSTKIKTVYKGQEKTLAELFVTLQDLLRTATDASIQEAVELTAVMELAVMKYSSYMPLYQVMSATVYSYRVNPIINTFNNFLGYGGVRYLTFNYTDAEWAAETAKQPNGTWVY